MAKNIVKIENCKGLTLLPLDNVETYFDDFAFDIEKEILRGIDFGDFGLLGDKEYIDLQTDLDANGVPQTSKYINLVNGINYVSSNGKNTIYGGIKLMLSYFIYCEYVKRNRLANVQSGTIKMAYENSELAEIKNVRYEAHLRWNKGVDLFNGEVYDYILFNQSLYPNWDFTRQSKFITHGIR